MAITQNGINESRVVRVFKQDWVTVYADFQIINKNTKQVRTTRTALYSAPVHTFPLSLKTIINNALMTILKKA